MNGKDAVAKRKKGPATVRKEGDVKEVKELIEQEIAEEMLGRSVKKGSGRRRGSITGWTKQIQELQAQQEGEEGEEGEEGGEADGIENEVKTSGQEEGRVDRERESGEDSSDDWAIEPSVTKRKEKQARKGAKVKGKR